MPTGPQPDLDEQRAALARQWFAELRQRGRDEAEAERRRRVRPDRGGGDGDLPGWPFCTDGADACGDGDGGD